MRPFLFVLGAIMVGSGHAVYQLGLQRLWAFMATPFDPRVKDQILVYLHLKEGRGRNHLKSSVSKAVFLCATVINYKFQADDVCHNAIRTISLKHAKTSQGNCLV